MVQSSHPQQRVSNELLSFLQQKIGLTENAIELGIRQSEKEQAPLAIVLWSYGLLTSRQYQEVLDWEINQRGKL